MQNAPYLSMGAGRFATHSTGFGYGALNHPQPERTEYREHHEHGVETV